MSVAGRHEGTASDYWLFDDIVKFIEGLRSRPTWMVLENVRNLLSHDDGRTAHRVFREVVRLGFDLNYGPPDFSPNFAWIGSAGMGV